MNNLKKLAQAFYTFAKAVSLTATGLARLLTAGATIYLILYCHVTPPFPM